MIQIIQQVLALLMLLLGKWFEFTSEKKAKATEIMKGVKDVKDVSSITSMFDAVNRL